MKKSNHTDHMGKQTYLGNDGLPHGFLHSSLSCEKTCYTAHSGTFGLFGLSGQIWEAHLGLGTFALRRK